MSITFAVTLIAVLALPFLIVGVLVGALTYVLGTPTVRKRRERSPSLTHASQAPSRA